jgi:DNA-binding NarL/FixJ family response regulator
MLFCCTCFPQNYKIAIIVKVKNIHLGNCISGYISKFMKKIVMLNEELGSQMRMYLALCDAYRVEIAEDVESVMYLLRKIKPEILLMDFNLEQFKANGKTGLDFLKKIKKKYNELKVVTILENKDKPYESEIQQNGADGIFYKPIKVRSLLSHVNNLSKCN